LISRTSFEPFVPSLNRDAGESLSKMTELDSVVQESLPKALAQTPPAESESSTPDSDAIGSSTTSATRAQREKPRYDASRQEYRPALRDPSLIEALIAFHRQGSTRGVPAPVPASGPGATRAKTAEFQPSRAPQVEAQAKPAPLDPRATRRARPILRPSR
jgi:hypothetical protein